MEKLFAFCQIMVGVDGGINIAVEMLQNEIFVGGVAVISCGEA